jgi:hypothetical protein
LMKQPSVKLLPSRTSWLAEPDLLMVSSWETTQM